MYLKEFELFVDVDHQPQDVFSKYSVITECRILDKYKNELAQAKAYCVKSDQFNRRQGFSLAVSRALKGLNLPKSDRTKVWSVLFNGKFDKKGEA